MTSASPLWPFACCSSEPLPTGLRRRRPPRRANSPRAGRDVTFASASSPFVCPPASSPPVFLPRFEPPFDAEAFWPLAADFFDDAFDAPDLAARFFDAAPSSAAVPSARAADFFAPFFGAAFDAAALPRFFAATVVSGDSTADSTAPSSLTRSNSPALANVSSASTSSTSPATDAATSGWTERRRAPDPADSASLSTMRSKPPPPEAFAPSSEPTSAAAVVGSMSNSTARVWSDNRSWSRASLNIEPFSMAASSSSTMRSNESAPSTKGVEMSSTESPRPPAGNETPGGTSPAATSEAPPFSRRRLRRLRPPASACSPAPSSRAASASSTAAVGAA